MNDIHQRRFAFALSGSQRMHQPRTAATLAVFQGPRLLQGFEFSFFLLLSKSLTMFILMYFYSQTFALREIPSFLYTYKFTLWFQLTGLLEITLTTIRELCFEQDGYDYGCKICQSIQVNTSRSGHARNSLPWKCPEKQIELIREISKVAEKVNIKKSISIHKQWLIGKYSRIKCRSQFT